MPDVERGARATRADPDPSPHLYDDEVVVWSREQPLPRRSALRILGAIPGVLVVAAVVAIGNDLAERDPLALTGARGLAVPAALATIAAAGVGWIWGILYRPVAAYLGVLSLHAVLTNRRLLFLESLEDGTTRVRHPFRAAMVRAGDAAAIGERRRAGGARDLLVLGRGSAETAVVRLPPADADADAARRAIARVLQVPEGAGGPADGRRRPSPAGPAGALPSS